MALDPASVGLDGVIVPDLPPEEGESFFAQLRDNGIDTVLLAAPTTTRERMQFIAERTRGFLYYVSLTGVTSARAGLTGGIQEGVALAKEFTQLPGCVGFGISKPEHGRAVTPDGYRASRACGPPLMAERPTRGAQQHRNSSSVRLNCVSAEPNWRRPPCTSS